MSGSFEIKSFPGSGAAVVDLDRGDPVLSLAKRARTGRDASAAAGPGPSTVAAHARNERKYAAITPVIELTDSESDEGSNFHSKRASNSNLTKLLSGATTRPYLPSTSESTTRGDKGKVKETVPLFMDSDEDSGQAIKSSMELSNPSKVVHPSENTRGRTSSRPGEADQPARSITTDKSTEAADEGCAAELVTSQQDNIDETASEEDIISLYVAQVLEIVPDVAPDYLLALIMQLRPHRKDDLINTAIQMLFEDAQYPRVERRGKRKSEADSIADARVVKKAKLDYVDHSQRNRPCLGGPNYTELSLEHLQTAFPYVPKSYVRKVLIDHNSLYAPSHMHLKDLFKRYNLSPNARPPLHIAGFPFFALKRPFKPQRKTVVKDVEFEKERQWVATYDEEDGDLVKVRARFGVTDEASKDDDGSKGKGKATEGDEDECPEGEGIECNCCFTEYLFENMIQCPEAHLFCKSCVINYASNQLGLHDIKLKCMDQSGCSFLFPDFELRRVLPQKLIDLYDRLKQQKEIEEADLEGLEECPFCDYKCVMDVDKTQEKLFRCGNYDGGCGAISCRECKRLDHLPKSCKEMDDDEERVNQQHTVDEAMSAALMRTCPKCQKSFIKESGCNKITCYTCQAVSCYICRKIISGYDHFHNNNQFNAASSSKPSAKCPLWDPSVDVRHAQEVKEAAEKALADLKSKNPDIDANAIKVDLPNAKQPPKPVIGNPGQPPPIQLPLPLPLPLPPYRAPPLPVQRGVANVNRVQVQNPPMRRRGRRR